MKIVVSKPELSAQISEAVFVGFPFKIEVNRAVRAFLKNGPASTACDHVTEHLDWFAAIWIDGVHATRIKSILKQLEAISTNKVFKYLLAEILSSCGYF